MRKECVGVLRTLRPREGQRPPKVTQQLSGKAGKKTPVSWLPGWSLVGDMQTVVGTVGAREVGRPQMAVREALLRTRTATVPGRSLVCRLFRSRRWSVCRAWRSSGSAFKCIWPRNSSFRTRWFQIWEETEDRGGPSPSTGLWGCWRWWRGLEPHPALPLPHHELWARPRPFRSLGLPLLCQSSLLPTKLGLLLLALLLTLGELEKCYTPCPVFPIFNMRASTALRVLLAPTSVGL